MTRKFFSYLALLFLSFQLTVCVAQEKLITEPDDGPAPLLNVIEHANNSVDLVMYGFTDEEFATALIHAKGHDKNIRVLLQQHPYKSDNENEAIINVLQNANVPLVYPDQNFKLTHQKTLITDDKNALVMTFNLTHSTFKNERNFALLITDPAMVQEIENVFSADYQHKNISVHNPDLIWSPDNSREKLLFLLHHARQKIKLYAEGLTDYEMVGALANASRQGATVEILTSNESKKSSNKQFNYLKKAGVKIHFSRHLTIHAKAIVLDDNTAVIGSINMTRPSINDNRELSVITHDAQIIQQLEKTFDRDWSDSAEDERTTYGERERHYQQRKVNYAKTLYLVTKLVKQAHRYQTHPHRKHHHQL
jgi:cardiolipin synthase A/B